MRTFLAIAALTLPLLVMPQAAAAAPVANPADVKCDGDQLAFAPALTTDRNPDGTPVKRFTPDTRGKFVPIVMVHGWTGTSVHTDDRKGVFSKLIDLTTLRGTSVKAQR